jgi:hypothetical protein
MNRRFGVLADRNHRIHTLHEPRREPARRLPRFDSVDHEQERNSVRRRRGGGDRQQIDVAADHDIEALRHHRAHRLGYIADLPASALRAKVDPSWNVRRLFEQQPR